MTVNSYPVHDQSHLEILTAFYRGFLRREPDPDGLQHWLGQLSQGMSLETIIGHFLSSQEYQRQRSQLSTSETIFAKSTEFANEVLSSRSLTIVDVGAQKLTDEDHIYAPLLDLNIPISIIAFEPLVHHYSDSNQKKSLQIDFHKQFIGDGQEHDFHVNIPDSTSSLLPFNLSLTERLVGLNQLQTARIEHVRTIQLDELAGRIGPVDFLKLDIQGFELPVLTHAKKILQQTLVIHCEVSFAEIYKKQALFSEVESFLRSQDFEFIDLFTLCRYQVVEDYNFPSRDVLGWGDAIFFRRPEIAEHDALAVQSVIALVIYKKLSLAAHLSSRCGGEVRGAFAQFFRKNAP